MPAPRPSIPPAVHAAVEDTLSSLERRHDVSIVFAAARGSHAWGAAGPDSDYDVGFVFVATDLRRYAHLEGPPTVLDDSSEPDSDDDGDRGNAPTVDLECHGWDVTTFARLLAESNQGAIDLLRSPVRYRTTVDPAPLRAFVERTFDPIELYHDWRAIARNNYRKYLSCHLVRDGEVYPIRERDDDGFLVDAPDGTTRIDADDERYAETATDRTVKRNLTVCRAAMSARYLLATGERGDHDLPALEFEAFLDEQAPTVFDADRIDRARDLLERKRRGEGSEVVGDLVGRSFATPPRAIDPSIHARGGPDRDRLDAFVDDLIDASRG
ncbi:nucleotidyltransferase domain-containing protein [Natrarchaeobaculum aegyptiacum]|uniref:Nucleotidyltransferase n=1 Tax=Natrarchaeobaculum aegyptiacum TaxID=745377 RepID=A0A2Z2HTS3_9EURY|nr:nucleotidyltransferase domain-containing protein [Natrarchaeobaculum aegyptiacum]ARS89525.1 nucleotidyltransferase [Natrarchaeobaculum aegyptiacum]